jgi:hypothetical protein
MTSAPYSRQDLLKTFMPLSESGKSYLEILLVNPKTSKPEGRGYFNDLDFLLEASGPHVGRYNFCLSNFAYAPEQIPTRASCNQFDRTLQDGGQEKGRAHSLSVALLFKPDLIREMGEQTGGNDQFLGIVYQIDGILGRLGLKSFSLDYFLTGMVARFCPAGALQRRPLGKTALAQASKRLMEAVEKQMTTQELKRFALASSVHGKLWDPLPGLPGQFSAGGPESVVVTSSGALQPGEDSLFAALLEEALDSKGSRGERASQAEPYSPNIQGLSQGWSGEQYEPDPVADIGKTIEMGKSFSAGKAEAPGRKAAPAAREPSKEVVSHLQSLAQGRWRWPMASGIFNRVHQGSGCGEVLLLQCDPFAADLGFNFLMQCAEGLAREGTGQIAVFSKGRSAGELALPSLCRHYKANPLDSRQPNKFPDAAGLAKVHASLFPNVPHIPAVNRAEGLDNVVRYLEHDYLIKQKKNGSSLMPLAIILDNIDEFWQDSDLETCKRLAALKQRLREVNGTLWITQLRRPDGIADPRAYHGLADHVAVLDHDGGVEAAESGRQARPPRAGEWEAGFHLDLSLGKLMHEISLVKIRFLAHGSHRILHGHYVYYRNAYLFREIQATAQAARPAPQDAPAHVQPAAASAAMSAAMPASPPEPSPAPAAAPQPAAAPAAPARGASRDP